MTDTTTVDDDTDRSTRPSSTRRSSPDDGGAGTDEPLELADAIAPEGPIKDRLLLPLLLPSCAITAVALYAREHLAHLPRGRLHLRARHRHDHHHPDPGRRHDHLRHPAAAHVVAGDGHGLRAGHRRVGRSALARAEPQPRGGRGGRRLVAAEGARRRPPLDTVAGPGTNFSGVPFDTVYTTTAGIVEINFTGQPGHTLLFTDPKLAGFELDTAEQGRRAKSSWRPAPTPSTATSPATDAAGMQATIDVT